jgi:DNA (cytosine-5)-methyltransferase 1
MTRKTKTSARLYPLADDESVYSLRQTGLLQDASPNYRLVDLFCGAGGLTLGFSHFYGQVFTPVWANDFNAYAVKTYEKNFGCHCSTDDILEITEKRLNEIPKANMVIGGPQVREGNYV